MTMARALVLNKERNSSEHESVATWEIRDGALVITTDDGDQMVFAQGEWIFFAMYGD